MARQRPLHSWERLDTEDELTGTAWKVRPSEHVGHEMSVLGRIEQDDGGGSMMLVRCECGEEYRMSPATVEKVANGIWRPPDR